VNSETVYSSDVDLQIVHKFAEITRKGVSNV